jgi:hypothetical protein
MVTPKYFRGFGVLSVTLAVLLTSCAGSKQSQSEGQRISQMPARLTVINQFGASMQIYFRPDFGGEIYLGRISIGDTKTLLIRPPFPLGHSRLIALPTPAAFTGEPIIAELVQELEPGDTLRWDLQLGTLDWRARDATK